MVALTAVIGFTVIAIVGFWLAGGVLLRLGGGIVFAIGVLELVIGHSPAGIIALVIGLVLWLVGHWHFAFRHHAYKSALADRVFRRLLPERLDPTRGWAWPVSIREGRERAGRRESNRRA